ncbi:hypothetical protein ACWGLG_16315 [Streptomyces antimycoticus]
MEILLIACMLAWAAGSQNEQSKLGLSPAQRAIMREQTRHEKAVRRIAEKHGGSTKVPAARVSLEETASSVGEASPAAHSAPVVTVPEAFRSGYRSHTPLHRVATPMGRRAGAWAAQGVSWAQDTGKGALRAYRKRRRAAGHDDPAPTVPPMPTEPPTVGTEGPAADGKGVSLKRPEELKPVEAKAADEVTEAKPADTEKPLAEVEKPPVETDKPATEVTEPPAADEPPTATGAPLVESEEPLAEAAKPPADEQARPTTSESPEDTTGDTPTEPAGPTATERTAEPTADTSGGVGRMAAEVTYESVSDESDELSIMCDDDVRVYDRIRDRAEREIGRGDALIAAMEATGFGPKVISWVARCKENYGVIHSEVDNLQQNTIAQGEAVVKAKALLEAGQGVYADIAKDMESVAERDAYISDAVDAEDASAHTEVYETKAAA